MLVSLLLGGALVVSACAVGQAALVLCGHRSWRWWSPALGFGVLLAIGGQITWLPQRARAVALIVLGATVAALLIPQVRRDLREALPEGLPLAVLVLLVAAIPYLAFGRWGIIGVNVQNDAAQHLSETAYLRTPWDWIPVAALGGPLHTQGYPIGPHGLAAALSVRGVGIERAWIAVQLVVPVFAALVALAVLPAARRALRVVVALAVGTTYLFISYYAQGAFKEAMEALFLLAMAAALGDWLRRPEGTPVARAVPLGLLAGATVYFISYGGLVWPLAAAGVFVLADLVRRRHDLRGGVRTYAPALGGGLLGLALIAGPQLQRMRLFYDGFFNHEPKHGVGNLSGPLSPIKAVGVWFSGDFRRATEAGWLAYPLLVLALLALLAGLVWWWRRRELAVPLALGISFLLWEHITNTRNVYNAAKGLPVLAPLLALCIAAPLLAAWSPGNGTGRPRGARLAAWRRPFSLTRRGGALLVARVAGALLLVAALASSFSVLRDAFVGLGPQATQLEALAARTHGADTLFLGNDHFAEWELRKARPHFNAILYNPFPLGFRADKPPGKGEPFDIDNVSKREIDEMAYVITPRTGYQSAMPRNFATVARTQSFVLYRRTGPTPRRIVLERPGQPGTVLDCASPAGRAAVARATHAAVIPRPIVLPQRAWQGLPLTPGASGTLRATLPPGRWELSVQYANSNGLDLRAPGLRASLPPYMGRGGPFWSAGVVTSDGRPITIRAEQPSRTWFGRLLGTPRPFRVQFFPGRRNLNRVAFTRVGAQPRLVPVQQACGRYVDFLS